jgi:hypothetical protein
VKERHFNKLKRKKEKERALDKLEKNTKDEILTSLKDLKNERKA